MINRITITPKQFELQMEVGDTNFNNLAKTITKVVKQALNRTLVYPNGFSHFFDKNFQGSIFKELKSKIKPGTVSITVVEGRNLQPLNASGLSDPFCILEFERVKFKTKVAPKTLNPYWNETFFFDFQNAPAGAEISVLFRICLKGCNQNFL